MKYYVLVVMFVVLVMVLKLVLSFEIVNCGGLFVMVLLIDRVYLVWFVV